MPKDPVCGKYVDMSTHFKDEAEGETYYFCSAECMEEFEYNTDLYLEPSEEQIGIEE